MTVPASVSVRGPGGRSGGTTGLFPVRAAAGGSFADTSGGMGSFRGTYTLERFVQEYGQLTAAGVLAGRLCDSHGTEIGLTSRRITVAAAMVARPGEVDVEIGPLDANLSGLMNKVHPIAMSIVPHPGWGDLGGVVLSAIAESLQRSFAGKRLVDLSNALLTILDPPDPRPDWSARHPERLKSSYRRGGGVRPTAIENIPR